MHHESAQATVRDASPGARVDHDGSGAQPDGARSGRGRAHTLRKAVLSVSDKHTSGHVAASEPAVQGGDSSASVPSVQVSPDSAAGHAKGARLNASAGKEAGSRMETPMGRVHVADKSSVTTPGDSSSRTLSFLVKGATYTPSGPSRPRNAATATQTIKKKGKVKQEKVQEPRVPAPDFVRWLQEQFDSKQMRQHSSHFFEGKTIFYVSNDYSNATDTTKRKLKYVRPPSTAGYSLSDLTHTSCFDTARQSYLCSTTRK